MSFSANAHGAHASAHTSHRIVPRSDKAVAVLMTNRPFANDFRTALVAYNGASSASLLAGPGFCAVRLPQIIISASSITNNPMMIAILASVSATNHLRTPSGVSRTPKPSVSGLTICRDVCSRITVESLAPGVLRTEEGQRNITNPHCQDASAANKARRHAAIHFIGILPSNRIGRRVVSRCSLL